MNVAFLGLGSIGEPMARHLAESFDLTVWNRTPEKATAFASERTAKAVGTPADAARNADIVITCLPSSREVEQVVLSENGLLNAMKDGAVLVDCTSGDPATSRLIAGWLHKRGVRFMDAPVSGGVKAAVAGTLTVMCGGDSETFQRAHQVIGAFGEKIVLCGPVGAGHALKAVNNALLALHIWSTAEGLATLAKAGVAPQLALDIINASSGRSNASMNLFPERVMTRAFPRTFKLALLDKDARIAAGVAREQNVPAPVLQQISELFAMAHASLGDEVDHVEVVKLVEGWAGVEIGKAEGA
jgi:3-hydroxyisobutyrate dehydrogenase